MSSDWYTRPVLAVSDTARALDFYVSRLGFQADWRHAEGGRLLVAQVSRPGCELILSDQWPEDVGRGRLFISLDTTEFAATKAALAAQDVEIGSSHWGYELLTVEDPDGNRLWFPVPGQGS